MSQFDATKLRRLDFSLLLVLRSLLRHGRSAAAAEELGLSPPAISHALARLRSLLGDPLFLRRPTGLAPTPRALALAPEVETLLALGNTLLGAPRFEPAAAARTFRLAANDYAGTLLMAPLLRALAAAAPQARLSVRYTIGRAALHALRSAELDLAIGRFSSIPEGFVTRPLFEETYLVVARRGHPALADGLDLENYLELGHLVVSFSGDMVGTVDEALRRAGKRRRVVAGSPMFLQGFAAVAESDLIATLPARLALGYARRFGLECHPVPLAVDPFRVEAVWAEGAAKDPGLAWLVETLEACAAGV